jgi:hypothetical protein
MLMAEGHDNTTTYARLVNVLWEDLQTFSGKTYRPLLGNIVERIGWERGADMLKDRVRGLRPPYLPPHAVVRLGIPPTGTSEPAYL